MFQNDVFWIFYEKPCTQNFLFYPIQCCARKTAYGPKKTLFSRWDELGSLDLREISLTPNIPVTTPEMECYVLC